MLRARRIAEVWRRVNAGLVGELLTVFAGVLVKSVSGQSRGGWALYWLRKPIVTKFYTGI